MRNSALSAERLRDVSDRLGDAIVDPTMWPQIMEQISAAAGATGAALLQGDNRTCDVPRTTGVDECLTHYFAAGWHTRDLRAERSVPLLLRGRTVVTDQDIITADEVRHSDYYNEILIPFGLQWFAGIGFMAGSDLWAMILQRSPAQGAFAPEETRVLAGLAARLSEIATLSKTIGQASLSSAGNALQCVGRPAVVLDRLGHVLSANADGAQIFDADFYVRERRLMARDQQAAAALSDLIDQMRATPDTAALSVLPIVVRRTARRPLVITVLPIDSAARTPFLGAHALLLLSDLEQSSAPQSCDLSQAFGLSPAEARLASLIATGISTAEAAERLNLSVSTVRNQLKAVFAKTAVRRQSELVALLSRF